MDSILIYLLQSSVSLIIFYFFYELLFKRDAFFTFNRYYLLVAIFISTFLPLLDFSIFNLISTKSNPIVGITPIYSLFEYTLGEVTISAQGTDIEKVNPIGEGRTFPYLAVVILIYFVGVIAAFCRFLSKLNQITMLVRKSKVVNHKGLRIIFTEPGSPTFSFFNYVFMDETMLEGVSDVEKIVEHEKIHIDQKHSVDLIIAELFAILQWYNPIIYLLKKTLKENHEFIADSDVITVYPDILSYTRLLIDNSSIINTNILTHNFSYSLLKRRLFMMKKTKNPIRFSFKLIWVLMAFSMVVIACSGPNEEESISPDVEYFSDADINIHNDSILIVTSFELDEDYVKFVVTLGKQRDTKIKLFDTNGELIKEFMDGSYDRGSYMVTWQPEDGGSIRHGKYSYTFTADDMKIDGIFLYGDEKFTNSKTNEDQIFTVVEVMPQYEGGMDGLISYLSNNIKYPAEAKENGIQGKVFVNFVVTENGNVSNAKVLRGIGSGCDEEAIRVVSEMPNWTPGMQRGKNVKVSYNLPINFVLDEKDSDTIYKVVEIMPEFPGGKENLMKYLAENINYPEKAKEDGVKGRVFISFVVEKDGAVGGVKLLRGIGSGCDIEAMRVIKSMPNWKPGLSEGKPVRVQYNLPIKFQLD